MQIKTLIQQIKDEQDHGLLYRDARIRAVKAEEADDDYSFELSFSSEEPYERWFGMEVLGHRDGEVVMDWIGSGRAPLLEGHDTKNHFGIVEKAWIESGRGKARVRFGRSAAARELRDDVIDGIKTNVSVGYEVLDMVLEKETKDGPDSYRVTKWRPLEVSIVALPADKSVGVGRNRENNQPKKEEEKTMPENTSTIEVKEAERRAQDASREAVGAERERIAEISKLGKVHRLADEADTAIRDGKTVDEFRGIVLDRLASGHTPVKEVPLSKQEQKDVSTYSFIKAIRDRMDGTLDGIEREMHQEAVRELRAAGLTPNGIAIPSIVLRGTDITVGGTGSSSVATDLMADSFIDLLRNRLVIRSLGATYMSGLIGNVAVPRKTSGATGTAEGETDANAESTLAQDQVTMSPSRLGTYEDYSKQFMLQSSLDAENLVRNDLALGIATTLENHLIEGTGSNDQITGILNVSGIGSVTAGDPDGAALTWADVVKLETEVAQDNADIGTLAYLTNAKVRGKLKVTEKASNTAQFIWPESGSVNGYKAGVTNACPSDLTKGSGTALSAIIFGNWRDLLIGQWGGLDLVVDPYTNATNALVRVTANMYMDAAVRHAESFAACEDVVTA